MFQIILFGILGIVCIGMEIFLPGGILGIIGAALMLASVYFAYSAYGVGIAVVALVVLGVLATIVFKIAVRLAPKTKMGKALFLQNTHKGVNVGRDEFGALVGKQGLAISELRPAGILDIEGSRYDGITEGHFIEKNSKVKVIAVKNNQLLVDLVDPA